jgi:hypothetical protein
MARTRIVIGAAVLGLVSGVASASTVIGLSIEDQARLSKFVVIGHVVGQQGVDHPLNGLETEVTLVVTHAFKGDVKPGDRVVFHTRGGELDGEISEAVGEAVFRSGQKVLVFVEEVEGRLYNLGLSYGVFNVVEDSRGRSSFMRGIRDGLEVVGGEIIGNGPFSFSEMSTRIDYAGRHPEFDNEMVRAAFGQGR